MFCSNCGKPVGPTDAFCGSCGKATGSVQQPIPTQQVVSANLPLPPEDVLGVFVAALADKSKKECEVFVTSGRFIVTKAGSTQNLFGGVVLLDLFQKKSLFQKDTSSERRVQILRNLNPDQLRQSDPDNYDVSFDSLKKVKLGSALRCNWVQFEYLDNKDKTRFDIKQKRIEQSGPLSSVLSSVLQKKFSDEIARADDMSPTSLGDIAMDLSNI